MPAKSSKIFLALAAATAILLIGPAAASTHDRVNRVPGLTGFIESAAAEFEVEATLIQAVIEVESMYRERAVSKVGARGLMQVKPSTAKWIAEKKRLQYGGAQTLYSPETNVRIGTAYLAYLVEKFGNISHAVMAYNLGPTDLTIRLRNNSRLPDTYIGKIEAVYFDLLEWRTK